MRKRLPPFAAGMLTMALVGSIGVTALAASGQMTITVDPINIQVNGQTFQPKDEKGNDVPVFALNGTTYAPLRALAEAYGLEVGYDAEANMATVTDPEVTPVPDTTAPSTDYSDWSAEEEAAYQEFKGLWIAAPREGYEYVWEDSIGGMIESYTLTCTSYSNKVTLANLVAQSITAGFAKRLSFELQTHDATVILWFYYDSVSTLNKCGWYDSSSM